MTKNQLCLTSLVAAVPGLILFVLMIMAFANYAGGPTVGFKSICALLLIIGAFLAAMPGIIFLRERPQVEKPKKEEAKVADPEETQPSQISDEEATFEVDEHHADSEAFAETIDEPDALAGSSDFDLGAEFDDEEKKA